MASKDHWRLLILGRCGTVRASVQPRAPTLGLRHFEETCCREGNGIVVERGQCMDTG